MERRLGGMMLEGLLRAKALARERQAVYSDAVSLGEEALSLKARKINSDASVWRLPLACRG